MNELKLITPILFLHTLLFTIVSAQETVTDDGGAQVDEIAG